MPVPTDAEIDLAVPPAGIPVRTLTNGVLKALAGMLRAMLGPLVINATPVEGGTVNLPNTDQEIILNLNPAGPLSAVHVVLPNEASSRTGERLFVASTQAIETVTFSGTPTVNNDVVTFAPGDNVVFFKNNANTWSRLIG